MIRLFLSLLPIAFLGCASLNEAYGTHSLGRRITTSQNNWRTTGSGFHVPGSAVQGYSSPELQSILDRLVEVSPLKGFPVKAYVVEDSQLNAFADGNSVYFHRPLLQLLQNDRSRVAGILAHELGHIIGNHVQAGATRASVQSIASVLAALTKNQNSADLLNRIFTVHSLSYSRGDEKEADIMGAALAHKAGFDAIGLANALEDMERQKQQDAARYLTFLQPHVNAYNQAVANYYASRTYQDSAYWSAAARQYANNINSALLAVRQSLGMTNPLYLTHPPGKERVAAISLVRAKEVNGLSPFWLSQQDPQAGEVYQTLMARSPK